ncbi:hypothetical protein EVAR_50620_1 [Eumeta japonica]|uniref:Uncharacterized protein n=1 Tax=Eumeta variegata TaxID=151549 RepID=A0A4C1XFS7_EUMVA|nr:hypothetical protein EVAR_50620_1 [Eumeta japonica]
MQKKRIKCEKRISLMHRKEMPLRCRRETQVRTAMYNGKRASFGSDAKSKRISLSLTNARSGRHTFHGATSKYNSVVEIIDKELRQRSRPGYRTNRSSNRAVFFETFSSSMVSVFDAQERNITNFFFNETRQRVAASSARRVPPTDARASVPLVSNDVVWTCRFSVYG